MLAFRSARIHAAVAKVDLVSNAQVLALEPLEQRVLLSGAVGDLVSAGVPAELVQDGQISRSAYDKLSKDLQAHIDPHWGQDDPNPNLYAQPGKQPTYMSLEQVHARSNVVDALPDFFPLMYSAASLDQTSQPGRNLLRFGTQVNNQGAGPGSFISRDAGSPMPTDAPIVDPVTSWINPDGSQNVLQKVYTFNGSSFTPAYYRAAGRVSYHSGHGHLHYEGYAGYKLRQRNTDGTPGAYVQHADGSGIVGAKSGFCLLTFGGTFTTESGASSSTLPGYNLDSTDSNGQAVPANCGYNQGVRVGHYDQYSSGLEGQWLDVTGVPNGQYFVEIEMDAGHFMNETNETNNAKTFAVTLNANPPVGGIAPDVYDKRRQRNDTVDTAVDMGDLGAFTKTGLTIHWGMDQDYFEFAATSTGTGTVSTTAASGNVDLYLYDRNGTLLKESTLVSGTDTVSWNFVKGEEYYAKVQTYNSTLSSNYQIAWNIKPEVAYPVTDAIASEFGPNTGNFRVDRNGPTTSPLTVDFVLGGTAQRGVDYTLSSPDGTINGNQITLGNLASSVNILVTPIADGIAEGTETVLLTIANGATWVSAGGTSQVTISDKPRLTPPPPGPGPIPTGTFGDARANDKLFDEQDRDNLFLPLL